MQRLCETVERRPPPRDGVVAQAEAIRQRICTKHEDWVTDLVRMATAGVIICGLRGSDISAPELVALVWLCLGGVRLRAHRGYLRYFDVQMGVWRPYSGLLPEGIFAYTRTFLNTLEGMFRSFQGTVSRDEEGVIAAIEQAIAQVPGRIQNMEDRWQWCVVKWRKAALWNKKGSGKGEAAAPSSTRWQLPSDSSRTREC